MRARCERPNNQDWQHYGGRGIRVCGRWHKYANFLADMGEPGPSETIERIDNNRNYEPRNCRWASRKEQARNTRRTILLRFNGREQSMAAWAEELGINYWTLHQRYRRGWSDERIIGQIVR
jgi:hypothetical protein